MVLLPRRCRRRFAHSEIAAIESLEPRRLLTSAAGALDHHFGFNGLATVPLDSAYSLYATAITADGRILAAGSVFSDGFNVAPAATPAGTGEDFALVRFNSDGSPDSSFGHGGAVTTDFNSGTDDAHCLAVQADGKILVAGSSDGAFALARYSADGSLDPTFGTGGKVTTSFGQDSYADVYGLTIQPDGKIILAGNDDSTIALARYNADGSLDPTFGSGGIVITAAPASAGPDASLDGDGGVAFTPRGKILVVGDESDDNGGSLVFACYNPTDGSLASLRFGPRQDDSPYVVAFAMQGNKVLTLDTPPYSSGAEDAVYSSFSLERHNLNGSLDRSFANGGRNTDLLDFGSALTIAPDGKILVTGAPLSAGGNASVGVARFNPDGTDDATFGVGGIAYAPRLGYDGAVAVAPDGGIIATGISADWNGFSAVRLLPNVGITPPSASLASVADVTDPNTTQVRLVVTYRSEAGIDTSSLDDDNLTATSASGSDLPLTFVDSVTNSDGSVTATYALQKDDGGHYFSAADNGGVSISISDAAVFDADGVPVSAGPLGSFRINIAPPPGGIHPPSAALQPPADITAPATVAATITVTLLGERGIDRAALDYSYLSVSGPGGFEGSAVFVDSVANPDGSVTAHYALTKDQHAQFISADNGTYTITLPAGTVIDMTGQTIADDTTLGALRVNVAPAPAGAAAPTAALAVTSTGDALADHTLAVTYRAGSGAAIARQTLDDYDLTVTGTDGYSRAATFDSATLNADGSVTALYHVADYPLPYPVGIAKTAATAAPIVGIPTPPIPPGGGGSPQTFTVTLSAGQVSDSLGVTAPAVTLGTFQATAPAPVIYDGAGGSSGPVFATNTPATLKGKAVFDPASPVIRGAHPKPIPKTNGKHHHHHKSSSGGSHSKGNGGKHHGGGGHKKH